MTKFNRFGKCGCKNWKKSNQLTNNWPTLGFTPYEYNAWILFLNSPGLNSFFLSNVASRGWGLAGKRVVDPPSRIATSAAGRAARCLAVSAQHSQLCRLFQF